MGIWVLGKRCLYCPRWFEPDSRQGDRQKACGKKKCLRARKEAAQVQFLKNNPDYFQGLAHGLQQKKWLAKNPGYLRAYRASHPDYVARDNRRRSERKERAQSEEKDRQKADMKVTIHRREIERIQGLVGSDMKDTIGLRLDELLRHLSQFPWGIGADMKVSMGFSHPLVVS
jgi:hypothetical protein